MKNIIILISFVLCLISNSFGSCEAMHAEFVNVIKPQKVTICRVAGLEPGRTDILGMYFYMGPVKALLVYGTNYDTMLYVDQDYPVTHTKCIVNDQYREIHSYMSSEQIASKLMSMKQCEAGYHGSHEVGYTTLHK